MLDDNGGRLTELPHDGQRGIEIEQVVVRQLFAVKLFRRTLNRMVNPAVQASMQEESVAQSMVFASGDYQEMKAARAENREPSYRGR